MKPNPRRSPRRPRFGIEPLEDRRLLAASFTLFPLGDNDLVRGATAGPDGSAWITLDAVAADGTNSLGEVARIDPTTGAAAAFVIPGADEFPGPIVAAPDGKLYFGPESPGSVPATIDAVDPTTGAIVAYPTGLASVEITGLAVGADRNLWFVDGQTHLAGSFNLTTHAFVEYPLPTSAAQADGPIVAGPEGDLWFLALDGKAEAVGSINPTTHAVAFTDLPAGIGSTTSIAAASDGNLWVSAVEIDSLAMTTTFTLNSINPATREVSTYPGGLGGDLVGGPDGNLWTSVENGLGEFNLTTHTFTSQILPAVLDNFDGVLVDGPGDTLTYATTDTVVSIQPLAAGLSALAGFVDLAATAIDPNTSVPLSVTSPLADQTVFLDLDHDARLDPGDPTANTDAYGYDTFPILPPGTYTVRPVSYPGISVVAPTAGSTSATTLAENLATATAFDVIPGSSILPFADDSAPFGASNPDVETAETIGEYNLILGHAPDPAGLAYWSAALKAGVPLVALSNFLLTSPEYDTDLVVADYRNDLGTSSETVAAVDQWVGFMQAGLTPTQVAADFLTSDVFDALFPTNSGFIQALYGDVLGYLPSPDEVGDWLNVLDSGVTRPQAVAAFLNSNLSDQRIVSGLYSSIYQRPADPTSRSGYTAALRAGWSPTEAASLLLSTPEFALRAAATVA